MVVPNVYQLLWMITNIRELLLYNCLYNRLGKHVSEWHDCHSVHHTLGQDLLKQSAVLPKPEQTGVKP